MTLHIVTSRILSTSPAGCAVAWAATTRSTGEAMLPRPAWCWGVSLSWESPWAFSSPCSQLPPCPIKVRGRRRRGPQEAPAPLAFTSSLSLSLCPAFLQSLSRMTSRPVLLRTTQYVPVGEPHCVAYCTHCVAHCTPVPSWPWRMWPSARHVLQRAVRHPPGLARMTCACVLVFVCVRGGRQTRPWKPSRNFCSRAVRGLHRRRGVAGWNCDQTFGLKPSPTSLGLASTWSPARTRANPLDAACGCFCTRRLKCAYVFVLHMSCTPRAACCSPL